MYLNFLLLVFSCFGMFRDVPERDVAKSGTGTLGRGSRDASSGTLDAGTRDVGRGEVTSGT